MFTNPSKDSFRAISGTIIQNLCHSIHTHIQFKKKRKIIFRYLRKSLIFLPILYAIQLETRRKSALTSLSSFFLRAEIDTLDVSYFLYKSIISYASGEAEALSWARNCPSYCILMPISDLYWNRPSTHLHPYKAICIAAKK